MTTKLDALEGIIFDMDGVIVDVSASYREAIRKTAEYFLGKKISIDEVSAIKNQPGMNNDWDATYALIGDSSIKYSDVKNYFQKIYLGENGDGLIDREPLFISIKEFSELKNKYKKLGIATGRPRLEAEYALKKNRIEVFFAALVCLEDVANSKPHPEPILSAMKKLAIKKTIYVGDSPSDVLAADAAEIPSIYIGKLDLGDYKFTDVKSAIKFLL